MWDDPPNSGQAEGRQSPGRGHGNPMAVGMVVAHYGIHVAGPTIYHLGKPLQKSRWPTGTGREVADASMPAGRKPDGRYYNEPEAYLYKIAEKKLTPDKRKRLYSQVFGSNVRTPRSRSKIQ